MTNPEALAAFVGRFVKAEFRDRFLHEAVKKPKDLHRRVCHDIEKIFDGSYRGRPAAFQVDDQCLLLGWSSPFTAVSWTDAKAKIDQGGGGYLVVKSDGSAFYAETEGEPGVAYAGSTQQINLPGK
ncbi:MULTISPECIES: hypothetical protein [unclassified Polaromonas]|uniref:hypothetical protein n=1 Tax=unclassified Polaromonas TaxID=2638319 RepID=UPI000F099F6F|nr:MULTISPECIES: hypothetical protein [unclassified Polaromonas]AYQ28873.1 hypothetical protein DT070_13080 [Polaromonas sp. SP1]QGJ20011.1 hypothetical protein F7R28_17525 [Polaromonas sp. Pch-P]